MTEEDTQDLLLEDDIHQVNADKIGISRKQVKTVTYAFLYGAGDEKIGHSYDPQLSASKRKQKVKRSVRHMSMQLTDWVTYCQLSRKLRKQGASALSIEERLMLIRLTKD